MKIEHNLKQVQRNMTAYKRAVQQGTTAAVNKAATQAKNTASREIRKEYAVKASDLNRKLRFRRARPGNDTAVIDIGGRGLRLYYYGARKKSVPPRRLGRFGATVKIKRQGGRKLVEGGFIARFKNNDALTIYRRTGRSRFPVKSLFGPSEVDLFKWRGKLVTVTFDKNFPKILEHEIGFRVSRLRGVTVR